LVPAPSGWVLTSCKSDGGGKTRVGPYPYCRVVKGFYADASVAYAPRPVAAESDLGDMPGPAHLFSPGTACRRRERPMQKWYPTGECMGVGTSSTPTWSGRRLKRADLQPTLLPPLPGALADRAPVSCKVFRLAVISGQGNLDRAGIEAGKIRWTEERPVKTDEATSCGLVFMGAFRCHLGGRAGTIWSRFNLQRSVTRGAGACTLDGCRHGEEGWTRSLTGFVPAAVRMT
jgi:hypothetical protein